MAETDNMLTRASQDLQTIEDFVNLPADTVINPRLLPSVNVGTLAGTRQAIFEAGGLPAKPFATKALMTASALVDGDYAMVTDDTVNNGLYVKTSGFWVKSGYDPLTQAKAYTDSIDKKLRLDSGIAIDTESLVKHPVWASTSSGLWLKNSSFTGYILELNTGSSFTFTGNKALNTLVYTFNGGLAATTGVIRVADVKTLGLGEIYTVTGSGEYDSIWVSAMDGAQNKEPFDIAYKSEPVLRDSDISKDIYIADNVKKIAPVEAVANVMLQTHELKSNLLDVAVSEVNSTFKLIDTQSRKGFYQQTAHLTGQDRSIGLNDASYTLRLVEGDVLEFYYNPTIGATFVERFTDVNNDYGYTLLAQNYNSRDVVRKFKFVATKTAYYTMHSVLLKSIVLNGSPVDKTLLKVVVNDPRFAWVSPLGFRETEEWLAYKSSVPFVVYKGDTIKIEGVVKGSAAILANGNFGASNRNLVVVRAIPDDYVGNDLEWTANETMEITLQAYTTSKFYIKRAVNIKSLVADSKKPFDVTSINMLDLPSVETVFATHLSYILKMEMVSGVENIAISQNLGKTWTYIVNTIGNIVNYHFFTDGTILLSNEKECFWTDDYLTLNKSTLLNKDGTTWSRQYTSSLNFFGQQNGDKPMFVDGQEVYVWGEYAIGASDVGIWYTKDYGRTIKRAADFQKNENLGGTVVNVRHIHKVYYHAKQESFYALTGDFGDEILLVKGKYNLVDDTWLWEVIGQGHAYKFGNMWCDDYYAYFTTDYTDALYKNYWGIVRVGLDHLGDPSKFRLAWDAKEGGWGDGSPYRFIADRNGNKVLIGELYTSGYIMVATTGYDFKRVNISMPVVLSFIIGPNDNGDIYMKADLYGRGLASNTESNKLNGGAVNITKMLRNAGLVNFMTGEQTLPHLSGVSE